MYALDLDSDDLYKKYNYFYRVGMNGEIALESATESYEPDDFIRFWNGSLVSILSRDDGWNLANDRAESCIFYDAAAQIAAAAAALAVARVAPDWILDENIEDSLPVMKAAARDAVKFWSGVRSVDVTAMIECCDVEVVVDNCVATVTVYGNNDVAALSTLSIESEDDMSVAAKNAIAAVREVEEAAESLRAARKEGCEARRSTRHRSLHRPHPRRPRTNRLILYAQARRERWTRKRDLPHSLRSDPDRAVLAEAPRAFREPLSRLRSSAPHADQSSRRRRRSPRRIHPFNPRGFLRTRWMAPICAIISLNQITQGDASGVAAP